MRYTCCLPTIHQIVSVFQTIFFHCCVGGKSKATVLYTFRRWWRAVEGEEYASPIAGIPFVVQYVADSLSCAGIQSWRTSAGSTISGMGVARKHVLPYIRVNFRNSILERKHDLIWTRNKKTQPSKTSTLEYSPADALHRPQSSLHSQTNQTKKNPCYHRQP